MSHCKCEPMAQMCELPIYRTPSVFWAEPEVSDLGSAGKAPLVLGSASIMPSLVLGLDAKNGL